MSPGYDQLRHDDFRRKITHSCMFCHNAYPQLPEGLDRFGRESIFPRELPLGIDCQRCHGPGSRHVGLASGGSAKVEQIRQVIVNPSYLGLERQMDVCMQCHFQPTVLLENIERFDRPVYSFRPGQSLWNHIVHFDLVESRLPGRNDRFEINSSAYRLRQSARFLKSNGRMTCTTCHDPHQTKTGLEAIGHFRERCIGCHDQLSRMKHPEPTVDDCAKCHMPKRRANDAVHVVMTDHLIQRTLPRGNQLASLKEDTSFSQEWEVVLYHPESLPPGEREIYGGIGQVQASSNLNERVTRFRVILDRSKPSSPEPYVKLALGQVKTGDLVEAEANFIRALQMDPTLVVPRYYLAEVLQTQGKLEEAIEQYRQVLEIDPNCVEAHNGLGTVLVKQHQLNLAIECFEKALRGNPFLAEAHTNLGNIYSQLGRLEKAIKHLEKALQIEPESAEAHNNLGVVYSKLGRWQEAVDVYKQIIRIKEILPRHTTTLAWPTCFLVRRH